MAEPAPPDAPASSRAPPRGASRIGRSALLVGAGILISRLIGLVRQRVFAHYFGDGWVADAFSAALRVPNFTQNLLGEGTLSASFIPIYAQALGAGDDGRAKRFARDVLGFLLLLTALISVLGAFFASPITHLIMGGFSGERFELAVHLVRIFFPMTGILALSAWSLGVLNSHRRFFLPYVAPVLWSVSQIFALFAGARFASGARLAVILGYGALAGAVLQLLIQLPAVRRLVGALRPGFGAPSPDVRRALRAFVPVVIGRGVVQFSAFFDTLLASYLPIGANAVLGYVQNIYLLPVSLFGVGAAAAALPEMARQANAAGSGRALLRTELGEALTRVAFTTIPTTLVFLTLPDQIVGPLYQTGRFGVESTALVSAALAAAGCGLLANAAVRVLSSVFYALHDTRTPATMAVLRVLLSVGLSYLLMRHFGVVGLSAGAAFGAWIEAALMARMAGRRLEGLGLPLGRWGKIFGASLLAAGAGYAVKRVLPVDLLWPRALLSLGAFGATYVGVAWGLGLPDVREFAAKLGRRFGRR